MNPLLTAPQAGPDAADAAALNQRRRLEKGFFSLFTCLIFVFVLLLSPAEARSETLRYDLASDVTFDETAHMYADKDGRPINGLLFWSRGKYRLETPVAEGKKNGVEKAWLHDKLMAEKQYLNGVLHGFHRLYDLEGNLRFEMRPPEGAFSGWLRSLNLQGKPVTECNFTLESTPGPGDFIGQVKDYSCTTYEYYENGRLKSETPSDGFSTSGRNCLKGDYIRYDETGLAAISPCLEPAD